MCVYVCVCVCVCVCMCACACVCAHVCFNRKLSHHKLVELYGVCTQHSPMCLVFEFMEYGCLSDYLRSNKGQLSQDVMLGMCLDVSEGMAYLESSNFIHRDLVNKWLRTLKMIIHFYISSVRTNLFFFCSSFYHRLLGTASFQVTMR